MVCREWQRKIPDFLNNRMSLQAQEDFIAHVHTCEDCYEELEIMYMLAEGLEELENGTDTSFNFKNMLDNKLRQAQLRCDRYRFIEKIKEMIMGIMYGVTVIGIVMQLLALFTAHR